MERITLEQFVPERLPLQQKGWKQLLLWEDETGTLAVPGYYVKGREPGPIVIAVAGVHGDEFEGMAALRQLAAELEPEMINGTFIGIPVINPLAYEGQTRETPASWDGLNLARQFPGRADGSVTERMAFTWSNWVSRILGREDVFIDFHSAGTRYEYRSIVAFHETHDQIEQDSQFLAQAFGWERVWRIPDRPDTRITFNGYIARCGIPTIATEVRGRGGCLPEDVVHLKSGLRQVLLSKKMFTLMHPFQECTVASPPAMDDALSARQSSPLTIQEEPAHTLQEADDSSQAIWSTEWLLIETMGFFQPYVELGENVEVGQKMGEICSLTGVVLEEVYAPRSGNIWGIRRFSTVWPGDYLFLFAFQL
ncbi:succinylglutamate desuccinylase/aspartoacylase family protein [Tengunoibacter tsumagoiensis]|uniref:Succinylglutamate desuccinylase/Aspartoacylase catalytic domain-containing protein n=1 Tax=Tengunoibacter tsumagoiensis TaxID=2014871 RepID=A0A402A9A6_9CHLR|nr:succinylglutamate desuccinylase/aspartoacylase family protein [Tengunoibacter tsumagoiensis]GCE15742.1 hypothetical protein KTT_56010 [Tengunoibacter tsumagoiensis]